MQEIYKNIENTNYSISNKGNLKFLGYTITYSSGFFKKIVGNLVMPHLIKKGYLTYYITNYDNNSILGGYRACYIHRLVAKYFIDNPFNLLVVNHKDGNKQNNNDWNLEWCTTSENTKHAWKTGLNHKDNRQSKLTINLVNKINLLIDSGFEYCEIEEELKFTKNFLSRKKRETPDNYLTKLIKKNVNHKNVRNANQNFVDSINELIKKGLKNKEIEEKLGLRKAYLREMKQMEKFKDFIIEPFNNHFKLSKENCLEILSRLGKGEKGVNLAKEFNVDKSMIGKIKERQDL